MKHLFIFLLVTVPLHSIAQSKELLKRIALNETLQRLDHEGKYDSVILLAKNAPEREGLYLYYAQGWLATAYMEKGNIEMGLKYLVNGIEHQDYSEAGNVKYTFNKYKLDSNKKYQYILRNFDSLHSRYNKSLNLPVLERCLEIFYTDKRMRNIWMPIRDTETKKCAELIMWRSDSMNIESMKELLRTEGRFPGINDIGISFTSYFNYIVTHMAGALDRDTLYTYLRTATLNGEIPNWYGPRMLDKLENRKGKAQLYGEFGTSDDYTKDGTYIYPPIQDIEHVDKRRAEFLLPPLYQKAETEKCVLPQGYDRYRQR